MRWPRGLLSGGDDRWGSGNEPDVEREESTVAVIKGVLKPPIE